MEIPSTAQFLIRSVVVLSLISLTCSHSIISCVDCRYVCYKEKTKPLKPKSCPFYDNACYTAIQINGSAVGEGSDGIVLAKRCHQITEWQSEYNTTHPGCHLDVSKDKIASWACICTTEECNSGNITHVMKVAQAEASAGPFNFTAFKISVDAKSAEPARTSNRLLLITGSVIAILLWA